MLLVWMLLILWQVRMVDSYQVEPRDMLLLLLPRIGVLTIILLLVCYWKGESPRWRWGKDT